MSRILIVDDNEDNRYSLGLLLGDHTILEASGGEEAVELARAQRPDCILLDVQMPGMDGIEACKRLRSQPETRTIPIILVTAHMRDTESVVRGLTAGADEYVTKPVAQQELLARVSAMLRIRELQEQLESVNEGLERQVRLRTEELRQIYATVPVGIYTLDAQGRVTSFNRQLRGLLGYQEDEVIGRLKIGDLFAADYDALYWLDLCRREGRSSCESLARASDGQQFPVLDERVANVDDVGETVGYTGYIQDLTREKRIREVLADQEKQVGVGHLAAGIVHEIANPIGGANQYLDALAARLDGGEVLPADELRSGLEIVRTALGRTGRLVRDLQNMARFTVDASDQVDLLALLRDLHTLMRHDLRRRGVTMELQGGPCTVRGDAGRLSQVFLNLVTNARDAMADGGKLTVEIGAEDSGVAVAVTDTGCGIAPADLEKVFEFLYTTKGEAGTGYGLAISRDIIEEHGGRLTVKSAPGKGSRFTVFLPFGPSLASSPA